MTISTKKATLVVVAASIALTLLFRLHLSLYRYFDTDEFAHLNWAYHLYIGELPFKEYFIHYVPLYHVFTFPVFLLPQSPEALLFGRIMMYGLFVAAAVVSGMISYIILKRKDTVLLTIFLLIVTPIMVDKGIEIRPDVLMMFFFLLTLFFLLKKASPARLFFAGVSLSLSLMSFPKIIFGLPALAFLLIYPYLIPLLARRVIPKQAAVSWILFIAGGALTGSLFLLYLVFHNILFLGIFTILQTTTDIYQDGIATFSVLQTLAPWPMVYIDAAGPSLPWALNILLLLAMLGGTALLAINRQYKLFGFYILFFLSGFIYLLIFPTPYAQYFIPIMLVGMPAAVYFITTCLQLLQRNHLKLGLIVAICITGILSYGQQYLSRIGPDDSGAEQMQVIRDVVAHIRADETVYDMAGSYVFRKSGYSICCYRYASFVKFLKPQPKPLTDSLIEEKTKFIVLDRNGYAFWQVPEPHLTFVRSNYLQSPYKKIYSLGYRYQCANGTCQRINYEGGTIDADPSILPIVIEESYKITTSPSGQQIRINGSAITDQEVRTFSPGNAKIEIPTGVEEVIIQLDR